MSIEEALLLLDPKNDEQWTTDGLPKVEVVATLTDNPSVTRADITAVNPNFNRKSLLEPEVNQETEEEEKSEDPILILDTKIAEVREEIYSLEREKLEITKKLSVKEIELDAFYTEREKLIPKETLTETIQKYIKSEQEQRMSRIGGIELAVQTALKAKEKIKAPQTNAPKT